MGERTINAHTGHNRSTVTTGGTTNLINIISVLNISSYPTQFTLIKYTSANINGAEGEFTFGNRLHTLK